MSKGPGILQREILRRASARRSAFTVREMALKLFAPTGPPGHRKIDDTKLGTVRRALQGLVRTEFLKHDTARGEYRRTSRPLSRRAEWRTDIGPVQIEFDEADRMLNGNHYLGAAGWRRGYCLSTPTRDALAIFAPPVAAHFNQVLPSPLELTRLWRTDDCPFPLSQFLGITLRWIKRTAPETACVFSYADPAAINPVTGRAHVGGIYAASNFAFIGTSHRIGYWLDGDCARVALPKCYRLFGTKSRAKIAVLRPSWRFVPGERKSLFVYPMRLTVPAVLEAIGGEGKRYGSPASE
jgi:hypothetical protein